MAPLVLLGLLRKQAARRPRPTRFLALLVGLLAALTTAGCVPPYYSADFEERVLIRGLTLPTAVAWTPDGRTLIAEKWGQLKVAAPGASTATLVLDIRNKVNSVNDRGMLGLAVDSSFASNRYVYLLYTYELDPARPDGLGPMVARLTRIQLNADNTVSPETVLLGSYVSGPCPSPSNTVDCIPSDGDSHTIGTVRSAPDGSLYVGAGDGASYSIVDPLALRSYDERSMAGKILRVDRNGRGLANHPFCPSDTALDKVCTKLYAKGFRNPFRFTLRPDGKGLVVGEVGWGAREELNLIRSGGRSYGWPCYEGTTRTSGYRDRPECAAEYAKEGTPAANVPPAYEYSRASGAGAAIMGGPEYAGDQYPAGYRGSIFIADWGGAFVKRLEVDAQDRVTAVHSFATEWSGVDLEPTPSGDLAYTNMGDWTAGTGSVVRIAYAPGNRTPVAQATATPNQGPVPLTVAFDARGSSDPDGDSLTYRWDFGDGQQGSGPTPSHTYRDSDAYTARVTVDDGRGRTATATVTVAAGTSRPVARIDAPAAGALFRAGEEVTLRGSATDAEDGTLPASAFSWSVVLHHGEHVHPLLLRNGVTTTTFEPLVDHDADSHYEITLTVTDSSGLTDTVTREVRPETVSFRLDSSPAGAPVSYAGTAHTAPWTTSSTIGFRTSVSAADSFTSSGRTYTFDRWSDGGARLHDIVIPASSSTLTAVYRDAGSSGLVLALGFDEGSGSDAGDDSGQGNHGTLRGATWSAAGRHGGALSFDGIDDWVTVPDDDSLDVQNAFTLEAWVKPRVLGSWDQVLLKEDPVGARLAYAMYATDSPGTGRPSGWVGTRDTYGSTLLTAGTWRHLAFTYDGSTARVYVDGALAGTQSGIPPPPQSTGPLRIGGNSIWGDWFDGLIDDVRVYARALPADQIQADMSTQVS